MRISSFFLMDIDWENDRLWKAAKSEQEREEKTNNVVNVTGKKPSDETLSKTE